MKIIERGVLPSEREWKSSCANCATRFEFLEKEAATVECTQREGMYATISCPVCTRECFGSLK